MSEQRTYERDGAEIYRQSFGIIRAEADGVSRIEVGVCEHDVRRLPSEFEVERSDQGRPAILDDAGCFG